MIENNKELINFKYKLIIHFKIKNMKEIKWFLEIKIKYKFNNIKIYQINYIYILFH